MGEMIWKIGIDSNDAKKAGKEFSKASESKKGSSGGGAFAGGFAGSILGNILSSVKQLFEPINAIATLLVAALFPILKPFLILFIKVGLLLYKWLSSTLGSLTGDGAGVTTTIDENGNEVNKAGDGLKSALFILGAVIFGVIAAIAGAPALLIAGIAILAGVLTSAVGSFIVDMVLKLFTWIDETFGTNFIEPLKIFFQGLADVWNGLYDMVVGLLTLDIKAVWDGFVKMSRGIVGILIGVFGFIWEAIKAGFTKGINLLSEFGTWLWELLKTTFKSSLSALSSLGSWLLGWIKDIIRSMNPFGGGGGGKSVNDAIITPNGDIIRTNPSDYLIATKTPGSFGGGSSGSTSVNVTINGGLITEEVARDIGKIIQRELNYGGGF